MFKAKISSIETFDPYETREDRMLLYKIMIKCSDVSNPSKDMSLYEPWCKLIMEEFVRQGDMEKNLGIPVSPYMDRDNMNVPSCQLGFMDYVVIPLFDSLDRYIPIPNITKTLTKNREYWYFFF
jgi:3'5'-cyclic nucleotide phosphodiesterase